MSFAGKLIGLVQAPASKIARMLNGAGRPAGARVCGLRQNRRGGVDAAVVNQYESQTYEDKVNG